MDFDNAGNVREAVDSMRSNEESLRSENRERVNDLFNGGPPFTAQEAEENNAGTNVNFLEATSLAHRARSTWNNALLKPGNYFTANLNSGPVYERDFWGHTITRGINSRMKRSRRYIEMIRATGAQVVLHGIGPTWWPRPQHWAQEEIGIEDLLVPDGTRLNLDNLPHFAIFQQFTAGQLFRATHGPKVDPGWNMAIVNSELKRIAMEVNASVNSEHELSSPEKIGEWYKANGGIWDSDRVPTVDCWTFFHQNDDDKNGRWYKKIILEAPGYDKNGFLYAPRRPFSGDVSQLLHLQFGDGANVAPFRYHSVRSLGFLLYAVCHLQNRLRCKFADAIFEACLMYFRNVNEGDRARLEKVDLQHMGLIPEGLTMVTQAERWQVNEGLVLAGLAQNRQLMSENASAFVQDVDQGTAKELTATEVMARLNSANALVSSLLSMAYTYEEFRHREIARRFCIKNSSDPDVVSFRAEMLKAGVPEKYIDSEYWEIEPERVMGGGNKTLELAQAKSLMEIKPQLDPPAQRKVLRQYVLAVTDDPDMAYRLVPEDGNKENPAAHDAEIAMGSLMAGGKVRVRQAIDHISYVEAMLSSMIGIVEDIKHLAQNGEMPQGQQIVGLTNAYMHVLGHIKIIAQDPEEQQRVAGYQDVLKNLMNTVKLFSQQVDQHREQQAAQNGDAAKNQALMLTAQTKAKVTTANALHKQKLSEAKFRAEEARKNAQTAADLQRGNARATVDLGHSRMKTQADIEALDAKTAATVRAKRATAAAASKAKSPKE